MDTTTPIGSFFDTLLDTVTKITTTTTELARSQNGEEDSRRQHDAILNIAKESFANIQNYCYKTMIVTMPTQMKVYGHYVVMYVPYFGI